MDVNWKSSGGKTALLVACEAESKCAKNLLCKTVKILIENGACVNVANLYGRTPLHAGRD